jgi:P-type Mg2+ transporter
MTEPSDSGLGSAEAAQRLAQYGPNDPAPRQQRSHFAELLMQFANPLIGILLLASAISAFVGEITSAVIIVVIVSLSVAVNFVQTFRSQQAANHLRATVAPVATVMRDGTFSEIPRVGVVPGDIIRLHAGDMVPADARLLAARDLHVQQSALTGESMPVEKEFIPGDATDATKILLGTSVVSGTATACVLSTGRETAFGDIATRLRSRPPDTEFDRGVKQFGALIMKAVFCLVLFILVVRIGTHRGAFESLLFAVALAVGLTPEFLPMITTVTLSRGAVAMAKHQVIVKRLSAMQNLGSIDVLCSDKTGTLTQGKMTFDSACDALGNPTEKPLRFARLNSKFETGIRSPLDEALLEQEEPKWERDYAKIDEIPFDFERRRVSIVVGSFGQRQLVTKGAPEGILACATTYTSSQGNDVPLTDEAKASAGATYKALSKRGARVLAIATSTLSTKPTYSIADETGLNLVGFVAFTDPSRDGAGESPACGVRPRGLPRGCKPFTSEEAGGLLTTPAIA